MVTITTADKALKNFYLDVVKQQLNTATNPFYNKIKNSNQYVQGKKVIKAVNYGLNGGFGFGSETGALPASGSNYYDSFETEVKNMYGVIKISDKAMRESQTSAGAFVNLLNYEMEGLLEAAKFNYARALYGNGSGVLSTITLNTTSSPKYAVSNTKYLVEGMMVDCIDAGFNAPVNTSPRRIVSIDRTAKTVTLDLTVPTTGTCDLVVQGSYQKEITGLGQIFNNTASALYGLSRTDRSWLVPLTKDDSSKISDSQLQYCMDLAEEKANSRINYITTSYKYRRYYIDYLQETKRNINTMDLEGGFSAVSFCGIPVIADKHCPDDKMYFLNADDFTMHYLCDWEWLADDGRILKQVPGYPIWTAILAKYAELICDHPGGQVAASNFQPYVS